MEEAEKLLKEALEFFNGMPRYRMRGERRDTYQLASKIDAYFRSKS